MNTFNPLFIAMAVLVAVFVFASAEAQWRGNMPRVGIIRPESPSDNGGQRLVIAFREGLHDGVSGSLPGKNRRLPGIFPSPEFVTARSLMSYSQSNIDLFRRAAVYVDKILKGGNPGQLPVEQPTKFELVINLNAPKQIGVTIPPTCWRERIR